mgnify:CR=1 FL=1
MSNLTRLPKFTFKPGLILNKANFKQDLLVITKQKKIETSHPYPKKASNQQGIQSVTQTRNVSKPKQELKQIVTTNPNENSKRNLAKKLFPNKNLYLNIINSSVDAKDKKSNYYRNSFGVASFFI